MATINGLVQLGFVLSLVCLTLSASTTSFRSCPVGEFLDTATNSCQLCSKCPMNEIIRVPCSQNTDTQCGRLYASEFRHQGNADPDDDSDDKQDRKDFNLFQRSPERPPADDANSDETLDTENPDRQLTAKITVPCLKEDSTDWRAFSMMLIAALSLLSVLFVGYVIISQVHMHRIHAGYKLANTHETTAEPIYCYSRIFPPEEVSEDNSRTRSHHQSRSGSRRHSHAAAATHTVNTVPTAASAVGGGVHQHAMPNDYVINKRDVSSHNGCDRSAIEVGEKLLPVIAADENGSHDDHVRVVYTGKK